MSPDTIGLVEEYLKGKSILVVDPSMQFRSIVARFMSTLASSSSKIVTATSLLTAKRAMQVNQPRIIISDFNLHDGSALEMAELLQRYEPNAQNRALIILSAHSDETSIIEAAEEDVDGYLLKPVSLDTMKMYFRKILERKVAPDEYQSLINTGKNAMGLNELEAALKAFERAKEKAQRPALAYYYSGEALRRMRDFDGAQTNYQTGLSIRTNHYKCMMGLVDVSIVKGEDLAAYELLRLASHIFPLSADRLQQAIELSMEHGSTTELDAFYKRYTNLEERPKRLEEALSLALLKRGSQMLKENNPESAVSCFTRMISVSQKDPILIKKIISHCIRHGATDEAQDFLSTFSVDHLGSTEYQAAHYLVFDSVMPLGKSIETGRKLIQKEIYDPDIYRVLIQRTAEAGFHDSAEHLANQAISRYPESREVYQKLLLIKKKKAA